MFQTHYWLCCKHPSLRYLNIICYVLNTLLAMFWTHYLLWLNHIICHVCNSLACSSSGWPIPHLRYYYSMCFLSKPLFLIAKHKFFTSNLWKPLFLIDIFDIWNAILQKPLFLINIFDILDIWGALVFSRPPPGDPFHAWHIILRASFQNHCFSLQNTSFSHQIFENHCF